jgi:HSP20 family molecular chaperone IbpA
MASADLRDWMWAEACALIVQAERMQRQFFQPSEASGREANWEPPVDVIETGQEFLVFAALPGVERQDLEVYVEGDVLSVTGTRHLPVTGRSAAIHRLEIPYGRFARRIRLPAAPFDLNRPELVNGCLLLRLTKRA